MVTNVMIITNTGEGLLYLKSGDCIWIEGGVDPGSYSMRFWHCGRSMRIEVVTSNHSMI